jgi:hypothetical protein
MNIFHPPFCSPKLAKFEIQNLKSFLGRPPRSSMILRQKIREKMCLWNCRQFDCRMLTVSSVTVSSFERFFYEWKEYSRFKTISLLAECNLRCYKGSHVLQLSQILILNVVPAQGSLLSWAGLCILKVFEQLSSKMALRS